MNAVCWDRVEHLKNQICQAEVFSQQSCFMMLEESEGDPSGPQLRVQKGMKKEAGSPWSSWPHKRVNGSRTMVMDGLGAPSQI
jgi:hypothetical protein